MSDKLLRRLDGLRGYYEVHDYEHSIAILERDFPAALTSLVQTLESIRIGQSMILAPGGSESAIPRLFKAHFIQAGWKNEVNMHASLLANGKEVAKDTHKIDYVFDRVALDIEWNSKDQTFDRDLFAFRTFHEFDQISVGILITRGTEFANFFRELDKIADPTGGSRKISPKYGASTTHIDKLIPRIRANRHGKCPLLVLGMRPSLVDESL